jgi:bifunctional non-homologous end joining protein LigD
LNVTLTAPITQRITLYYREGYSEGRGGTPYQHTENEERITGILPQLLNPIEEHELKSLIQDSRYCAQEKYDGRRVLIRKNGAQIHGINRKGLVIGLPDPYSSRQGDPGRLCC